MFVLEVGTNHLGKVSMAERYVDYFNNSNFNEITFMCQSKLWYKKKKQILPKEFYIKTLKLLKKKIKKLA